jgi:preprotein translocase subunit SecA
MVSRTIEGAQTRVEGYNFDARKHVVQYDDVINRQRETIYHERERILRARDLAPTILAMVTDEVATLVAEHTAGDRSDWNREGLKARLQQMVPTLEPSLIAAVDEATDSAALTDQLIAGIEDAYERKRAETGEEGMSVLERLVLLRVIDSLWIEHLTAVDDMRRGIGLRAYSQRDPLNEFKVEAYRMFDELKSTIRHDVSNTVFRVTVTRDQQPQLPQQPRRMTEGRLEMGGAAAAAASATSAAGGPVTAGGNGDGRPGPGGEQQTVRVGPKIGRNDPCWCGSGKKYKRCHGA